MKEAKFDGKAGFYAQNRPSYPQEFIDYLYTDVGMTADSIIANIGSGTGLLTRLLLEKGSTVFAVEPSADMRAQAEADLGGFDKFVSVNSHAENTTLADSSVDFITVATAFHWFNRQAFKAESRRILKTGGQVIIVYNSRDEESDLVKSFYEVNRKYCPDFQNFTGSGTLLLPEKAGFFDDFFAETYAVKIIPNDILYDEKNFVARSLSSSYALRETDANFPAYVNELQSFFQKHSTNGILTMPNITHSCTGTVS